MLRKLAISVVTTLLLVSCVGYRLHPGAPDKAASIAFDALLVAHQVIESAKDEFQHNNLPDSDKFILNDLIKAYDIGVTSLEDYDKAVKNGDKQLNSYYAALVTAMSEVNRVVVLFKSGGK